MSPTESSIECSVWIVAREKYHWSVNLRRYSARDRYPNHFNRTIGPRGVTKLEDAFRAAIDGSGTYEIAGEVCYWKNYGSYTSRDSLTSALLDLLGDRSKWTAFAGAVKDLAVDPSMRNFEALRSACNQPNGFATPITFLSFYEPSAFPMADKRIALWWATNRVKFGMETTSVFHQRNDGLIYGDRRSWNAYTDWKKFCTSEAAKLTESCSTKWRARDVEMAVWEAQKHSINLTRFG